MKEFFNNKNNENFSRKKTDYKYKKRIFNLVDNFFNIEKQIDKTFNKLNQKINKEIKNFKKQFLLLFFFVITITLSIIFILLGIIFLLKNFFPIEIILLIFGFFFAFISTIILILK